MNVAISIAAKYSLLHGSPHWGHDGLWGSKGDIALRQVVVNERTVKNKKINCREVRTNKGVGTQKRS